MKTIVLIGFLVVYTVLIGYKLISHPVPFFDWDESIYMQVGKEMINAHSLTPLWQGQLWFEKPPLAPFIFGIINALPFTPEIATRIFSLVMSVVILCLIYAWANKIAKNKWIAFLTVVLTAFNPIFLQRAQTVNTDTFLFIGWLGYTLVFPNFWQGLLFLFIGVFSKSILGFYPLILFVLFKSYQLFIKKIDKKVFLRFLKISAIQIAILSIWYILMFVFYGKDFIQTHFGDHLLRRITSSIESHFGQRTFYIDIVVQQYGFYLIAALIGIVLLLKNNVFKKFNDEKIFLGLLLIPWFIFLNLTKTKISWYLYMFIPQVSFLIAYSLTLLKKHKRILPLTVSLITIILFYRLLVTDNFFKTFYSQYDENYQMAILAKDKCNALDVLLNPQSRETFRVLGSMNLLISTSKFYGSNPSIVYYFGKKVNFIYDKNDVSKDLKSLTEDACFTLNKDDLNIVPVKGFNLIKKFDSLYLFQKKAV